ncbi:MAG: hypothetical protein ACYCQJ_02130 [Nitrososphaerales archaeon]
MKYTLSYNTKFGMISVESEHPSDLVGAFQNLKEIASSIELSKSPTNLPLKRSASSPAGKGETATILRELESGVLATNFFSKARTTGETKDKLREISGHNFTSRKVSQALGILWHKRVLKRSGTRNHYTYSK